MADLIPVHAVLNGTTILHYIRTSDVYGESGGMVGAVGIRKVKEEDLTGSEEIIPVKELLRTGQLQRIGIRYKNDNGKKFSAKILVARSKIAGIFAEPPTQVLEGVAYKVGEEITPRGNIVSYGQIRRASYY